MSDQAASLRQLSQQSAHLPPLFALTGASHSGISTLCAGLAAASALQGKRPLLLDHQNGQELARLAGVPPSASLASLNISRGGLTDLMVNSRHGVTLVNLYAQPEERHRLSARVWQRLASEFSALEKDCGLTLVDAPDPTQDAAPLVIADNLILVISPQAESITRGYASMKRLAGEFGRRRFNVLVNRASGQEEAQNVFARLSSVAGDYLGVSLRWVGFVPEDQAIRKSQALRRPVVEAFPDSEAAQAFSQLAAMLPLWHAPDTGHARSSYLEQLLSTSKTLTEITDR
ncbi:flagellar synthesis regulator FleN [Aquitalea sp. S1-19]|uniref:Flagellar synthesis regulator FleN n=1 Tax=Craterilacuibacter sinensis TaxID=2686017 RepID=A0A845BFZ4_9NEIS|nr:flagellar synthesis regulator FleN [Craterilacuibacter sinensis]MCP9758100.1 flagellar synthesis regulator FleN [Aquitalea sp. S1-19]MXR35667.1 flagellar synthesis regulator FleN [Craterilacuibacter sinensis]RQW29469.1 flagellar synthesis regulator FleN [Rhodobacteraceae bacterium CH30]